MNANCYNEEIYIDMIIELANCYALFKKINEIIVFKLNDSIEYYLHYIWQSVRGKDVDETDTHWKNTCIGLSKLGKTVSSIKQLIIVLHRWNQKIKDEMRRLHKFQKVRNIFCFFTAE